MRQAICFSMLAVFVAIAAQAGGTDWKPTNGPYLMQIRAISAHPDNPGELLVGGTGGVYLTRDKGRTYQKVSNINGDLFYRHPEDPLLVFAPGEYSTDGGRTWTRLSNWFQAFGIAPGNPDIVYALGERGDGNQNWVEVTVSIDRGHSFQFLTNFAYSTRQVRPRAVWVDPADSDVLYSFVGENLGDDWTGTIYRSVDGAQTWQMVNGPRDQLLMAGANPMANAPLFALGKKSLYVSDDGGSSWDSVLDVGNGWFWGAHMVFDPQGSGEAWLQIANSLWHSTNGGSTWTRSNAPWTRSFGDVSTSPFFNGTGGLYASDGEYLFFSEDAGQLWDPIRMPEHPAPLSFVAVDPVVSERVYAGQCCHGPFFRSTDGGDDWDRFDLGINGIFIDPDAPAHIYLPANNWIYESRDYGSTWQQLSDFRAQTRTPGSNFVSTFHFSPDNPQMIYIGAGGYDFYDDGDPSSWGHIFVSEDGGKTWSRLPFFEPNWAILGIAAKPGDPHTMVVVTSNTGIFRTTDGGNNWEQVRMESAGGGRHYLSQRMQVDPLNPDLIVVGGNELLVSEDFGATWQVRTPPEDYEMWRASVLIIHPLEGLTRIAIPGWSEGTVNISDDLGRNWNRTQTGIEGKIVALAASDDGTYYATTENGGVVKGSLDLPTIASIDPTQEYPSEGARVIIRGIRFGDQQGTGSVKFNWINAPVLSWSDMEITCTMPGVSGDLALILTTDARERIIVENPFKGLSNPSSVIPPEGWVKNPDNGHYYRRTQPLGWTSAEEQAVAQGGHLVTINDRKEELWLRRNFGEGELYLIGFNDLDEEGEWKWSSGEEITYTNWAEGEPNNYNDEDVAAMNWGGSEQIGDENITYFGDSWNDLPEMGGGRAIIELPEDQFVRHILGDSGNSGKNPIISWTHTHGRHYGTKDREQYDVAAQVQVGDPQGLNTIESVILQGPDGTEYARLSDDGNQCDGEMGDGLYGWCSGESFASSTLPLGDYALVVTDADGNVATAIDPVERFIDMPRNPSPAHESMVGPEVEFKWDAVGGATEYILEVCDADWNRMWRRENLAEPSVIYDDDGKGQELGSDTLYHWTIWALDGDGNESWHDSVVFTYDYFIPEGPVAVDFDLAEGDQGQQVVNAVAGRIIELQLNVEKAPEINGWSVNIEYDPEQVRYVSNSFQESDFIPGISILSDEKGDRVSIGGAILGKTGENSGDGTLGTLSFEVLDGFTGSTQLAITRVTFRRLDGVEDKRTVRAMATITNKLSGDFNRDGVVDFGDFFLFADHFGTMAGEGSFEGKYDLDENGAVDFDDFFIFADYFSKEARAKLMVMAEQYLGLPAVPSLEQNYPNPFNSSTTLRYRIAESGPVHLDIFDATGQKVKTLVRGVQGPGGYEIRWDGTDDRGRSISTGIYLTRLQAGESTELRKMLLIK